MIEFFPSLPADGVAVRLAASPADFEGAYALRHRVFCEEQGIFDSDLDETDAVAITIVAFANRAVIGTVRIHQTAPGVWMGSRLAVDTAWRRRRAGLGAALIRMAVGTAHGRGCTTFLAHVQSQNVKMFETLHWQKLEDFELHGRSHSLMQADLMYYPPILSEPPLAYSAA